VALFRSNIAFNSKDNGKPLELELLDH